MRIQLSNGVLTIMVLVLMLAVGGLALAIAFGYTKYDDQRHQTRALITGNRALSNSIAAQAHIFAVSQKSSTKTRVSTVTQRCNLTRLIIKVLVRVHDQIDAKPFMDSEKKCLQQLTTVEQINAQTPNP